MTKNHAKTLVFTTLDILQLKKIDGCENINRANHLYLNITHANVYITEKGVNKYLFFDSSDKDQELLKK